MESNTYLQNGGGKNTRSLSSLNDVNASKYTSGRLSAMMQGDAFVVSVSFMFGDNL